MSRVSKKLRGGMSSEDGSLKDEIAELQKDVNVDVDVKAVLLSALKSLEARNTKINNALQTIVTHMSETTAKISKETTEDFQALQLAISGPDGKQAEAAEKTADEKKYKKLGATQDGGKRRSKRSSKKSTKSRSRKSSKRSARK
jgi:hypothetical protein